MRRATEYWERRQQLADRCARGGALCTARRSPAIPYRSMAFFGQKLPIIPSSLEDQLERADAGSWQIADRYATASSAARGVAAFDFRVRFAAEL